jgi:hypothetical protein
MVLSHLSRPLGQFDKALAQSGQIGHIQIMKGLRARLAPHTGSQVRTDLFNKQVSLGFAKRGQVLSSGRVLRNPFSSEGPIADFGQDLTHRGTGRLANDAGAARVVAPFSSVADLLS